MITEMKPTASVAAQPIVAPDYRLVMRHRGDGHELCEWREYEGRRMDYRLARKFMLGVEGLLPSLHKAGQKYYLAVEPIRGGV